MDDKPVKIDKWDSAALKNALDDAAKKVKHVLIVFKEIQIIKYINFKI